jgi:hypothetical protein
MSRILPTTLVLALLALPCSPVLAHGHGGGYVVASGPAAAIPAPATQFYGGYAQTAYYGGYGPTTSYAPTASGYFYAPGTTYVIQPTGAYVPGASPYPSNFGYQPTIYRASFPGGASPYGGWAPTSYPVGPR